MKVKVEGPLAPYPFSWRVVNAQELKRGSAIKQVKIYLFDFEKTLEGGGKEVNLVL